MILARQLPDPTGDVIKEPAISRCSCLICRRPDLYTDGEHVAQRLLHADRHQTFEAYWRLRRRTAPAPTPEIRRRLPIPLLRRLA